MEWNNAWLIGTDDINDVMSYDMLCYDVIMLPGTEI